jgi:hypothetical protein
MKPSLQLQHHRLLLHATAAHNRKKELNSLKRTFKEMKDEGDVNKKIAQGMLLQKEGGNENDQN